MLSRVTRRVRIEGNVQGVYFRQSTREQAQRLGITGYAWNLSDGSVEVMAQGAMQAVDELLRWLRHGPPSARVDRVLDLELEVTDLPASDAPFEVRWRRKAQVHLQQRSSSPK